MDLVAQADWLVDVGPLAGERGGNVVYSGPVADYDADTPTANALAHRTLTLADDPRTPSSTSPSAASTHSIDNWMWTFGGPFTAVAGVPDRASPPWSARCSPAYCANPLRPFPMRKRPRRRAGP